MSLLVNEDTFSTQVPSLASCWAKVCTAAKNAPSKFFCNSAAFREFCTEVELVYATRRKQSSTACSTTSLKPAYFKKPEHIICTAAILDGMLIALRQSTQSLSENDSAQSSPDLLTWIYTTSQVFNVISHFALNDRNCKYLKLNGWTHAFSLCCNAIRKLSVVVFIDLNPDQLHDHSREKRQKPLLNEVECKFLHLLSLTLTTYAQIHNHHHLPFPLKSALTSWRQMQSLDWTLDVVQKSHNLSGFETKNKMTKDAYLGKKSSYTKAEHAVYDVTSHSAWQKNSPQNSFHGLFAKMESTHAHPHDAKNQQRSSARSHMSSIIDADQMNANLDFLSHVISIGIHCLRYRKGLPHTKLNEPTKNWPNGDACKKEGISFEENFSSDSPHSYLFYNIAVTIFFPALHYLGGAVAYCASISELNACLETLFVAHPDDLSRGNQLVARLWQFWDVCCAVGM